MLVLKNKIVFYYFSCGHKRVLVSNIVWCILMPSPFPFSREHIKVTDVMEYMRRSTLHMTNLNTANKRKCRSSLYHIVENDFATTFTTKWKLDSREV